MTAPPTAQVSSFVSHNLPVSADVEAPLLLYPVTFDGRDILRDGSYTSGFPSPTDGLPGNVGTLPWEQPSVAVAGGYPRALSSRAKERELDLDVFVKGGMGSLLGRRLRALDALFAPGKGERLLVASDGIRDWQLAVRVASTTFDQTGDLSWRRYRLVAADGRWQAVDLSTDAQATSAASLAWTLDGGSGSARAPLAATLTPLAAKPQAADYRYRRQVWFVNRAPRQLARHPLMVSLQTDTEVAAGRMLASGDDLRVLVDGREVDRWLGQMNTSLTGVWFPLDFAPARTLTTTSFSPTIPATGNDWVTNGTADMPESGALLIDSEVIAWTGKAADGKTLQGITRGARGSTASSHGNGSTGYLIEHQIDLVHGWSAAPAPTRDPDTEPMFRYGLGPATCNNGTWIYDVVSGFATARGRRPGEWSPGSQLTNDKVLAFRGQWATVDYPPTADGGLADGVIVGAATRHEAVDDPSGAGDADATYVRLTAAGQAFSVASAPAALPRGSLARVIVGADFRADTGKISGVAPFLIINGVRFEAPAVIAMPSYGQYQDATGTFTYLSPLIHIWETNPATGQPWAADDLASVEFGIGQNSAYPWAYSGAPTELRVTRLTLTLETVVDGNPATALGLYVVPTGDLTGHPTYDTWVLPTPAGVAGRNALTVTVALRAFGGSGPPDNAETINLVGVDADGVERVFGTAVNEASIAAATVYGTPNAPLDSVGIQLKTDSDHNFNGVGVTAATVVLGDAPPYWDLGAREDLYLHRWSLANADTGQAIQVLWPGALGVPLTVNAASRTVYYGLPGYNAYPALVAAADAAWLEAEPGDNDLAWTDLAGGAASVQLALAWRERLG
jgi:hypothetical protein